MASAGHMQGSQGQGFGVEGSVGEIALVEVEVLKAIVEEEALEECRVV